MESIPGPPGWPLIGNLWDINVNNIMQSFMAHAEKYGPIYELRLGGVSRILISNHELVNEVCTRKEFVKHIIGAIKALSYVVPDGLFTTETAHKSWGQGRRTLNPAFTRAAVRKMFPEMLDITSQLVLKWARHGPRTPIDVSADFTRLTLDTLALTAMDTRFNSFYHDELHPFVQHFGAIFAEVPRRSTLPAWYQALRRTANREFEEHNAYIRAFCADVLEFRRARERDSDELADRKDLFTAMLHRRDPVTGEQLADSVIIDNMVTFLFAGHDTTSALLSFLVYHLIRNRDAYAKLQHELDRVLAGGAMTIDHLDQLPYTKACLRETLRLDPPAQGFILTPQVDAADADTPVLLGGGRYAVRPGQSVVVLIPALHRDRGVFGDDAAAFRPERMAEDRFQQLPKGAFKPFGNGVRNCIGTDFAMQEATVAAAVLFQTFDFELADPDYELRYSTSLTRKPEGLSIYARLRPGVSVLSLQRSLIVPAAVQTKSQEG